jgi:hypothetical protein
MLNWHFATLLSTGLIAVATVTFGIVGVWRPFPRPRRTRVRPPIPSERTETGGLKPD